MVNIFGKKTPAPVFKGTLASLAASAPNTQTFVLKPKISLHPPTSMMVTDAIQKLNTKKGSSVQAIKKYIVETYKLDPDRQAPFVKRYLKKAVESGDLIQVSGKGASGSFKFPKVKVIKAKPIIKGIVVAMAEETKAKNVPAKKPISIKTTTQPPKAVKGTTRPLRAVKGTTRPLRAAKDTTDQANVLLKNNVSNGPPISSKVKVTMDSVENKTEMIPQPKRKKAPPSPPPSKVEAPPPNSKMVEVKSKQQKNTMQENVEIKIRKSIPRKGPSKRPIAKPKSQLPSPPVSTSFQISETSTLESDDEEEKQMIREVQIQPPKTKPIKSQVARKVFPSTPLSTKSAVNPKKKVSKKK